MALPAGSTLVTVLDGSDASPAVAVTASGGAAPVKLSRAQLRALVESLARRLAAAGVKPGDVVSISMANTVEFLIAFLAVTHARAVAAPLNAGYKQVGPRARKHEGVQSGMGAASASCGVEHVPSKPSGWRNRPRRGRGAGRTTPGGLRGRTDHQATPLGSPPCSPPPAPHQLTPCGPPAAPWPRLGPPHKHQTLPPSATHHPKDEFTWYMEDAETKLLILPAAGNAAASAAAAGLSIPVATVELKPDGATLLVADAEGSAPGLRLAGAAAAAAAGGGAAAAPVPLPSDVALFLHTSGTTSKPKGVPLTHVSRGAGEVVCECVCVGGGVARLWRGAGGGSGLGRRPWA
jgi:hypothetical protein